MSPTSSSPSNRRRCRVSATSPIGVARTSQRSHSASTSPTSAGSTTHSIRSCDSEVLKRGEQVALEQLEAALDELRLLERVADLDGGPLRLVLLGELGAREHGGAADS